MNMILNLMPMFTHTPTLHAQTSALSRYDFPATHQTKEGPQLMAPAKLPSRFVIGIIVATLAYFAAINFLKAAAAPTTIRVGYPQLNGGQTPLWNIADSKLNQKYNLDIKPVYIPGGVRLTQSMLSGAVDIAMTGGAAVNAMLSGGEFI
jgi:hypothetical protein